MVFAEEQHAEDFVLVEIWDRAVGRFRRRSAGLVVKGGTDLHEQLVLVQFAYPDARHAASIIEAVTERVVAVPGIWKRTILY